MATTRMVGGEGMVLLHGHWQALVVAVALVAPGSLADNAGRDRRGQEVILALESRLEAALNIEERGQITDQINEVRAALENNRRAPVPETIDAFLLPATHYRYASARVGLGTKPAANIHAPCGAANLDLVNPPPSSFWRPKNIAAQDLHAGFDRIQAGEYENTVWDYAGPKDGFGGHAGFEARSGSRRIKVKFGEVHSEPFTARIFHALGYNVDPTDYSPGLKVHFDRELFTQFNSRRPVNTRITLLGVLPVWTIRFQPTHDPFRFIRHAVMRDGSIVSGAQLKRLIEVSGDNDPGIEHLVTVAANVQPKREIEKNIGPWSFDQLGHEDRRELRGAGLLAAWVGWHDSRFENTRLRVALGGKEIELKHYFSDVGGGLGQATGLLSRSAEDIRAFPEVFTRPEMVQGRGRMTLPFRIINFRPIERTAAFEEMTLDDARWMARLIGQLTVQQIEDALRASGFDESETKEAAAKLLSRRRHMLEHLGLAADLLGSR